MACSLVLWRTYLVTWLQITELFTWIMEHQGERERAWEGADRWYLISHAHLRAQENVTKEHSFLGCCEGLGPMFLEVPFTDMLEFLPPYFEGMLNRGSRVWERSLQSVCGPGWVLLASKSHLQWHQSSLLTQVEIIPHEIDHKKKLLLSMKRENFSL